MSQRPFPEGRRKRRTSRTKNSDAQHEQELNNPVQRYFADRGVRETIESVIVAVMLALLFRAFEAEAFVIPTGSMAPTLMGRHRDVECDKCGYRYRTGASEENPDYPLSEQKFVTETACPICHYNKLLDPEGEPNERSFSGDRILVDKFAYAFSPPERWDVIVFKYPGNPKQNYIKRLIGLPGETLKIVAGDIYIAAKGSDEFRIQSKDPRKLRAMLQLVDDTHFLSTDLKEVGWPSRWQEWSIDVDARNWDVDQGEGDADPIFRCQTEGSDTRWLRYRHLAPHPLEWPWFIERGELPPRTETFTGGLITDFYPYNDSRNDANPDSYRRDQLRERKQWLSRELTDAETEAHYQQWKSRHGIHQGLHWVGDLAAEFEVEVEEGDGKVFFDLVEGGVHFTCEIDLTNGDATLTSSDSAIQFVDHDGGQVDSLSASTSMKGRGKYSIRYANCDDRIYFWVNNRAIRFNGRGDYQRSDNPVPKWSTEDAGDAEPIGIGAQNVTLRVDRARVLRDIYYTQGRADVIDYTAQQIPLDGVPMRVELELIQLLLQSPEDWSKGGDRLFDSVYERPRTFPLGDNQLFPMGDNSPASADARSWNWIEHYIEGEDLVGKALFVYWPHSWNRPIPFFPNFRRMGFIR